MCKLHVKGNTLGEFEAYAHTCNPLCRSPCYSKLAYLAVWGWAYKFLLCNAFATMVSRTMRGARWQVDGRGRAVGQLGCYCCLLETYRNYSAGLPMKGKRRRDPAAHAPLMSSCKGMQLCKKIKSHLCFLTEVHRQETAT